MAPDPKNLTLPCQALHVTSQKKETKNFDKRKSRRPLNR